ncbi:MAG: putative signal transducing protein [Candidatus Aquicultorales bacterium]
MSADELITVKLVHNRIEAEVIKSLLESAGIKSLLRLETVGQLYGLVVDGLGAIEICVSRADLEAAREVIEAAP